MQIALHFTIYIFFVAYASRGLQDVGSVWNDIYLNWTTNLQYFFLTAPLM